MNRIFNAAIAAIALTLPAWTTPALAQQRFTATVTGQGPDVILIPGLASSGDVWDATVKQLSPTHRVHVIQVSGFAGAPAGANAEGEVIKPLAAEIAAYAAKLDHPAIIGHSIGGLMALEIAAAKPDSLSRVMVVDALPFYSLLYGPTATAEAALPFAEQARTQILAMPDDKFAAAQTQTMAMMSNTEATRPTLVDWSVRSDRHVMAQAMYDAMIDDARPLLPAIKAPVTVLYAWDATMGQPQELADDTFQGAYAGLPTAKLTRIDGSFHFIMLDQPAAFAAAVTAFLN
ncbi:MAG: alpha/beta hydrolase [Hyphomonadaceae bacterium]